MQKMIAYCGIVCSECPGFIATQKDSDEERKKVAEQWSKMFSAQIKPEDVNCDGCLTTDGRLIGYCRVCEIRKCAREKVVENCALCAEYSCEKLSDWLEKVPDAKATLEEVRKSL
ncbi:DUF3795 domain-containing protein [bacterium]|nr:DUF3795 domain-containing protein [bacterium]